MAFPTAHSLDMLFGLLDSFLPLNDSFPSCSLFALLDCSLDCSFPFFHSSTAFPAACSLVGLTLFILLSMAFSTAHSSDCSLDLSTLFFHLSTAFPAARSLHCSTALWTARFLSSTRQLLSLPLAPWLA